jgi:hypothetical protein
MDSPVQAVQSDASAKCHFLNRLSPELRNHIYGLVLCNREREKVITLGGGTKIRALDVVEENQPALLCTCRQIRNEGIQMYYRFNRFNFTATTKDETALLPVIGWLKRIG